MSQRINDAKRLALGALLGFGTGVLLLWFILVGVTAAKNLVVSFITVALLVLLAVIVARIAFMSKNALGKASFAERLKVVRDQGFIGFLVESPSLVLTAVFVFGFITLVGVLAILMNLIIGYLEIDSVQRQNDAIFVEAIGNIDDKLLELQAETSNITLVQDGWNGLGLPCDGQFGRYSATDFNLCENSGDLFSCDGEQAIISNYEADSQELTNALGTTFVWLVRSREKDRWYACNGGTSSGPNETLRDSAANAGLYGAADPEVFFGGMSTVCGLAEHFPSVARSSHILIEGMLDAFWKAAEGPNDRYGNDPRYVDGDIRLHIDIELLREDLDDLSKSEALSDIAREVLSDVARSEQLDAEQIEDLMDLFNAMEQQLQGFQDQCSEIQDTTNSRIALLEQQRSILVSRVLDNVLKEALTRQRAELSFDPSLLPNPSAEPEAIVIPPELVDLFAE